MWNPIATDFSQPVSGFWAPRASRFWDAALDPLRRHYLHHHYKIEEVKVENLAEAFSPVSPGDGVLLAPNHSHDSDPHVMMDVARQAGRRFYFMAAWQIFTAHHGIDGWVMQRMGAFSVDREGCDRQAIRQAVELLTGGECLVVFPEGEVYHLNDRLMPLRDGVAFMAVTAQRDLDKSEEKAEISQRVWVIPTAIRYRYLDDIRPDLESAMAALEQRMTLKPRAGATLPERIVRFGELMLTLKEKDKLGHPQDPTADLPSRLRSMVSHLLDRLEATHLHKSLASDPVPLRVKTLRQALIETLCDESSTPESRRTAHEALDEVQLAMQLFSYPGDYITTSPTPERMAETIEKFEEDIHGISEPKGRRTARVILGQPIDVKSHLSHSPRPRQAAADLTTTLQGAIQALMTTA